MFCDHVFAQFSNGRACIHCLCSQDDVRRPSWPEVWMNIAFEISTRSYDPRLRVGAIVVSEDNTRMLSVGYNGSFKGGPHVHESSEPGKSGFIHAELNALIKCDYDTNKKKHLYVTHSPCRDCSKIIVNAGISQVIYSIPYRDQSGIEIMRSTGIEVFQVDELIKLNENSARK